MIKLPTKRFGKAAKACVKKILPALCTIKRVRGSFVIRDSHGFMLGYVDEGSFHQPKAALVLTRSHR